MLEVWKDIEGFEGIYQISNLGNVKNKKNDKLLKPQMSRNINGYLFVRLFKSYNNETKAITCEQRYVHRLVGTHFLQNPENKQTINHIDGIKTHNIDINLEWKTRSENDIHKVRILKKESGINHYKSQITFEELIQIRKLISIGVRALEIAQRFRVSRDVIYKIKHHRTYKYI